MITLYTTHCPLCSVLETKLKAKDIAFEIEDNAETIINKGIMSVPALEIDGQIINFGDAIRWVNQQ